MKQFFAALIFSISALISCQTKPPVAQTPIKPVLLTIGNKKITTEEFFQSFTKNQFSDDTTKKTSVEEYLKLYTNLKVKVMDAVREGRDTTEDYKSEIATYRKQLAQAHLTDKILLDNLVAEAYQNSKEELRCAHILIPIAAEAAPADTLSAYRAAMALKARIVNEGEDFSMMAERFSKDAITAKKGGDVGYFTAFQMVYAIEKAAYKLKNGQVSDPVRTSSGYHLIKLIDRKPSRGTIQVAHILVSISPSASEEGKSKAKAKIEQAQEKLKQEAWEIVCREFSDDATSKINGGVLPSFTVGENVPAFEDAAFKLSKIGEVSEPILTNYGWHIIKLVSKKAPLTFNEMASNLRQKVVTNSRGEVVQAMNSQRLRKLYKIEEGSGMPEKAFEKIDTTLLRGEWKYGKLLLLDASLDKKTMFEIGDKKITVDQFFDFLSNRQQPKPAGSALKVVLQKYYQQFIDRQLAQYEEDHLEEKSADFKSVMDEIKDGVLLSQVMEKNVWEYSLNDSLGQKALYDRIKDKFRYPERYTATIATADNDSLLMKANDMLTKMPYQLKRKGDDLLFDAKNTTLTAAHRESLTDVAVVLITNANYIVEVSGYCDDSEPDSLSAVRIRNVVKSLAYNRIPMTRIMEKDNSKFKQLANQARNRRISFQYFSTSKKDVEKSLNATKAGKITITDGVFIKENNEYLKSLPLVKGLQWFNQKGTKGWVNVENIEPSRIKTFAEARGAVINEYQRILEAQWIDKLKQQFPVQINDNELQKLK